MELRPVSLADRYDISCNTILISGTQALVRLPMMQKVRDRAAGHETAGYITGYRGSPLGGVDISMARAQAQLEAHDIVFEPGLNEDLAATALWGTQQAELRGEGRFDGVFGLWYGKGPGVDRCGDVFRHANLAGTSPLGGVLAVMGDDHTGESSTTLHHSEFALVDALMPILSPAGVQEILDYGILGWALSRYSGCWVGLKGVKDTVEATAVIDGRPERISLSLPTRFEMPPGGLNIRLVDDRVPQEARLHDYKRFAAEAFGRANRIDRRVLGKPGAKIGIVSAGKSWLDLVHALELLGIDADRAEQLGITTYKVGMVWPLDMESFHEWAEGLDLIICVEEKRKLIEVQAKEAIFSDRRGRRVIGWKKENGELLFTVKGALDPVMIARRLGGVLEEEGRNTEAMRAARAGLDDAVRADNAPELAARLPYFCSGCPHNTSTKVPEGSRAYAGIGCHFMVQWMDRETIGYTHMGGEGANWVGESRFSTRDHVFQNLGDGTYNHSGVQAIRAALASDTSITFKILYNDAVAMTGGQANDGGLSPEQIAHELLAMGVKKVVAVIDPKEVTDRSGYPARWSLRGPTNFSFAERDDLDAVQRDIRKVKGVTAIIYVQTCAAEKRRRRKRGKFPDPDRRVFINPAVCEGCGDCGVQSNCVSILPLETEFGRKRQIDQSSCNKDFSCLKGFCPSFVTVQGAEIRKAQTAAVEIPTLPGPKLPAIEGTHNSIITGVGGTGVVTVGAVLAMAAHLEGKGAGLMEMAGLAQKGGAVHIHCRIAAQPGDITAIRVAAGEAHSLIGGDLVVAAGARTLGLMRRDQTGAVVNSHEIITGDFTRDPGFQLPTDQLSLSLRARLGDQAVRFIDATGIAVSLLGDAIYANTVMLGAAWQAGLLPLSREALRRAIELNGAGVEKNLTAFELGRWAVHDAAAVRAASKAPVAADKTVTERIAEREAHLAAWGGRVWAKRYVVLVERARAVDEDFGWAVAQGAHKLMSYKDEYEVARLHAETLESALDAQFSRRGDIRFHMAPPIFSRKGSDGKPRKMEFGPWMLGVLKWLSRRKNLRGTWLDPFGRSAERRMERALIEQYFSDIEALLREYREEIREPALALATLPLAIRGFGHVKRDAAELAAKRREELLEAIRAGGEDHRQAAE